MSSMKSLLRASELRKTAVVIYTGKMQADGSSVSISRVF